MKRKKAISALAIILVALMLLSLLASVIPASAYADELDDLRSEKNRLSNAVEECKQRIETLKEQKANVLQQKAALDEQNKLANEQLDVIADEIEEYNELIEQKENELNEAKAREQEQLDRYRARVRAMEESGGYNIIALIVQSENFADLLTAIDDMGEIMASDKVLEKQLMAVREETEAVKADYESARAEYEGKQDELRDEQAKLEQDIEDAYESLASLEEDIAKAIKEYEAAEAAEAAAAATIANAVAAYNRKMAAAAAAAAAAAQQQPTQTGGGDTSGGAAQPDSGGSAPADSGSSAPAAGGSTGSLMWPVPCSTRVTSRFGYRSDPFTGASTFHSGIDIDGFGNDGNSIVAADGGTVITASYDGGYGNYVMISHGGMTTLYAHMSGIAVGSGDSVYQGQTIGYLGSTGRSTGTHCHFEVFVGDDRVDPASYFSGLSYWNC